MTFPLFLDVVVAVLLLATIVYAAMLNRRLAGLRSNKAELEELIRSFGEACARAEAGVRTLRSATDEATRLQQYLDRSQTLRDDLAFLLDRGSSLADRLEGGVRTARTEAKPRDAMAERGMPTARPTDRMADRMAERPMAAERPSIERPSPAERAAGERALARGGLDRTAAAAERSPDRGAERTAERLAERIAERAESDKAGVDQAVPAGRQLRDRTLRTAPAAGQQPADSRAAVGELPPRSKAERELLQALRARR